MGTNKESIELLEVGPGTVEDGLYRLEIDMTDKLKHVETILN